MNYICGRDWVRVYVLWSSQPKFAKLIWDMYETGALRSCLLSKSLQVTTFKQLPEYYNCAICSFAMPLCSKDKSNVV
ncbi:hypothetical protein Hanom_Chr09g00839701 [Helianthus anomalus]